MKFLPIPFERIGYPDLKKYQKSFKSIVRSKQKGLNQFLRSKVPIESKSSVRSFSGVQASSNIFKSQKNLINPSVMKNFYSLLSISLLSLLFVFNSGNVKSQLCAHEFYMIDSYGDGWNGATVTVYVNGVDQSGPQGLTGGSSGTFPFLANSGDAITMVWTSGSYNSEITWNIRDMASGATQASGAYGGTDGGYGCNAAPVIPCHGDGLPVDGTTIDINMVDSYGDSWDGAYIRICVNGSTLADATVPSGSANTYSFVLSPGDKYALTYVAGSYESEHSYSVVADGIIAFNDGPSPTTGNVVFGQYAAVTITYDSPNTCYDMGSVPNYWTNGTGGLAWVYGNTSTPSGGTGPSGDADGGPGGFYFTEASGIYNTLYRMTGIADFSSTGNPLLTFYYHMYGGSMGTLNVVVDGTSVFSVSGNQSNLWRQAIVALDPGIFTDPSAVVIAFEGTTGTSYTSDICIDQICILDCGAAGSISGTASACESSTSQLSQAGSAGGTWASDDTGVATVSSTGLVTAVSAGSANITYTIAASGSCPGSVETFAFTSLASPTAGTISGQWWVDIGATTALTQDGSAGGTWSSDDTNVATIDASTGVVTGVGAGNCTVTYAINAAGCVASSSTITVAVSTNIIMPSSGSITVTTCTGNLYDDGGSGGEYSINQNGTVVLMPGTAGEKISISGTLDSESGWDEMFVYDGTSSSDTELTPSGGASGSGYAVDYTASNVDGALTIVFTSDGSVTDDGFALAISCVSACSGTPTAATASVSAADDCATSQGTISVSGVASGAGLSHDWETSDNGSSGWTSQGVSNTTVYSTPSATTYFRYKTTCDNSGLSAYSNVVAKTVAIITSGGNEAECGSFTGDLSATTNIGNVEWYAAASGGSALTTGNTYSPGNGATASYYAASSGCPGTRTAITATVNENPVPVAAASTAGVCSGSTIDLTGTSGVSVPAMGTGHCAATGGTSYATSVTNFTFDGDGTDIDNTTGQTNAYEDYTSSNVATGTPGSSANISMRVNTDGNYTVHGKIWIDLNNNDDFTDAGEEFDMGDVTNVADGATSNGSVAITLPSSAGEYKIRVFARYGSDPTTCLTSADGEVEDYKLVVSAPSTFAWTSDVGGFSSASQNPTGVSQSVNTTYTVTETDGNGCIGSADVAVPFHENPVAGSVAADLTLAHWNQVITWTGSGSANGDYQLHYEWTDSTATAPTGAWNAWVTSNPQTWNTISSGGNLNRRLWVKSTTASTNGCGTVESTPVSTLVTNCRADASTASVTAGTTSSMPYGETITWDANYYGTFDSWEYEWSSAPGVWNTNWSTSDPHSWTAVGQPAGQTLSVRAKITGPTYSGSPTCTWYSDEISTFIIDCDADAVVLTNNEAGSSTEVTCDNTGISVTASNADSYTWSDGGSTSATREFTSAGTYTVTGHKTNGCQTTTSITVTENNTAPSVSITNNESGSETEVTCANTAITVTASGADTYTWSDGASTSASRDFSSADTYVVTGTETATGCTNTAQITITLNNSAPTVGIQNNEIGSPTEVTCTNTAITVTANGADTYTWSDGASTSASRDFSSADTYTVTGTTTANGCTNTAQITITVDLETPAVTSASVTDVTTCGINTYDVTLSSSYSGVWSVSPADAVLFDDNTAANTTVTANPAASGFNTDLTLTWTQGAGGCIGSTDDVVVKFNVPVESFSQDTDTYIWGGLTDTEWTTASNWYKWDGSRWAIQSTVYPTSTSKVHYLSNGNAGVCVSSSNDGIIATSISSLNVEDGAEVNLGSQSISISGDITNNNGTIIAGSSTIELNGTSLQTISGSGSPSTDFSTLIINNSSGVTVDIPFTVKGTMTMTSGNLNNGSNVITIGTGSLSTVVGTLNHTSGIVTGKLRRYFTNNSNSKFFPVGSSTTPRDVTVSFNTGPGTNQYLTVGFNSGAPQDSNGDLYNGLPLQTPDGQWIQNCSNEGYWEINPTNDDYGTSINGKSYNVSLRMNNLTGVVDYSKVRIIKSAGSSTPSLHHTEWSGLTHINTTGSNSDFTTTAGPSTGFSFFGGGGGDGGQLPVELVSFNGGCNDGVVDLTWQTASEYNSSHYDVEHSRDGVTWDVVYTQSAAGNSTELLEYSYTHAHAIGGDNYYRLTQVDIDGTEKTYDVINASCTETTSGYFSIFPNPSSGSFQVIMNNSDIIGGAVMNIVDTKGTIVLQKPVEVKTGINMYLVNQELSPGIYYISVKNGNKSTIVLRHSVQ